ncbi:adenosylcobalamin-dependent ribonucleoside-diphosphate reductase [Spirochaetia bacterium 38H-sp]|uniref:Vitamin B12-dependent ribonucleotide reductase n=1 Tax=Rarispira pelagica TaxID=3141764 RepID=A0ABU9U8L0_9SPIR
MKFKRFFTRGMSSPYDGIEWVERKSEIRDLDGRVIFSQERVVVPSFWSQIATDIIAQKYFRKAGVPEDISPDGREFDARQVFHRLAYTWKKWGEDAGYFDSEEDAQIFYDEICYMLAHQMAAPNSPQWFNTGLHAVYGIEGPPQGHYYVDHKTGKLKRSASAYERPQPHACFILDVEDDLVGEGGLMDTLQREARLFKYGSGTGSNFSRIRAEGEPLSGGGVSSGLLSFLKVFDRSAAAIKSGGTTRRAAKMVVLDVDHPDIFKFVRWKVEEEYKVASLVAGSRLVSSMSRRLLEAFSSCGGDYEDAVLVTAIREAISAGLPETYIHQVLRLAEAGMSPEDFPVYSTDWEGEAYNTVSGQSSNNSVRVSQAFLEAVENDGDWELTARTSGQVIKVVKARELWKEIIRAAWQCADPGIQFDSTINEWHTCPADGKINASNPCSEYMFLDDTACNLASINFLPFYDMDSGRFDVEGFSHAVDLWTVVLEISVVMAQFPSKTIAEKSYLYRTLGLGFANLGSLLMVMGLPYDSPEGRAVAGALSAILTGRAYHMSARMAAEWGAFARYEANREHMLRVIRNHRRAAYNSAREEYEGLSVTPIGIDPTLCPDYLVKAARKIWDEALELGENYGYRNAQVTAIAPTGTIGLLMDCDTTGIEPDFAIVKFKKLAGGGYFKIINRSVPPALRKLGYSEKQIEEIVRYCVGAASLKGCSVISHKKLKEKGFTDKEISAMEERAKNAFSIKDVFGIWNFSQETLSRLGLPEDASKDASFDLLAFLGFSRKEIETAEEYICGSMTLEGAPHLKEEHLSVFDTASPAGKKGTRSISWRGHVLMMAAVQPFVSGAISKTVNMPQSASIRDVEEAYLLSWKSMLKAVALYRDASKLSQPLSAVSGAGDGAAEAIAKAARIRLQPREEQYAEQATEINKSTQTTSLSRGQRETLPSRRAGYTQKAKIGGHSLFIRTGEYQDGRLGEIFLDMYKEGAAFRSLLNSFAIAVSIGLQYGVPLQEFVDAFVFTRFEPNGMVQGHPKLRMATSVIDLIFRDLGISYLGRDDLAHIKEEISSTDISHNTEEKQEENTSHKKTKKEVIREEAVSKGYEGDACPICGNFTLVRNGTCLKCETCGSTTGCS